MNRTILTFGGVLSASSLLLLDSAIKGSVLLALAAVAALMLRRDSAATRHLVWMMAIVAMLIVPVLSATLPQWRVLPNWMSSPRPSVADSDRGVSPLALGLSPGEVIEMPARATSVAPSEVEQPTALEPHPVNGSSVSQSTIMAQRGVSMPIAWNWMNAIPLVWAIGFVFLMLRLSAARWMLWNSERLAIVVGRAFAPQLTSESQNDAVTSQDPIVIAMTAICSQLKIGRPIILLLHPHKTIPVVWGIFRYRLMLPAAARHWSDEQLQSVLMHELAHIKRGDTLVQLLTQIACALHWFNPFVWFAAWRLDIERERSCDDLVLASGIRPSAYAAHLLDVVSGLTPARWTQACGLAMARKSSLEGRLTAVLGKDLNRRGVSFALAGVGLFIAVGIAVPIAMLRAADEERNQPTHKDARAHYEQWQRFTRTNGDIPGALIGELAKDVEVFIGYNPTWETVPRLKGILLLLDATHDWKPADAITLLDEVAGVQDTLLKPSPWKGTRRTIRNGEPLPKIYADALWGEEEQNGLRAAWVLEPSATEHRIGAVIKARLLVQNRGQATVIFQVPTFHQGQVKGTDTKGAEVQVSGISWTTMALLNTVRLRQGEYIEINTPGVGIGPGAGMGPWAGPRVGSNVLAKPDDELTLTYSPVPLDGSEVGVSEEDPHVSGPGWWLAYIKTRLNRELPLPADVGERTRLLDRAVRELFSTAPTAEETEAFIVDKTPDALDALAKRLAERADVVSFSGKLPTAPVKFRVLDVDANADKQPRVVLGPGEYPLSGGTATSGAVTLKIIGRPVGDRRTNDAGLLFEATEATGKLALDPHKLDVPDGWGTWAIVCRPGDGFFYLLTKGAVRKIDYTNPREVTDTPATDLPAEFHDEVKRQLDIAGVSAEAQAEIFEKPAPPAALPDPKTSANTPAKPTGAGAAKLVKLPDEDYTKTGVHCQNFLEEDAKRPDGRLMGRILDPSKLVDGPLVLGLRVANDATWNIGSETRVELVVRNQSKEDVKFAQTLQSDVGLTVVAIDKDGKEHPAKIAPSDTGLLVFNRWLLPKNGYVTMVKSFTIRFDAEERFDSDLNVAAFHLPPGDYKLRCQWNDAQPEVAHEGEWTGELVNEELEFTLAAAAEQAAVEPKSGAPDQTVKAGFPVDELAGERTGKLTTRGLNVEVIAPDAPEPKPRVESVVVGISKDGEISFDRKKMTLDELKIRAARNAKKWFTIQADEDVPYAKVIAVIEALKASGVTQFSFAKARVGDGKYRVANRTGSYEFDEERRFYICQPFERKQWFTVAWPAKDGQPAKSLRLFPNASEQTRGTWAVVWEPGMDVLWWVDDSDIGKMTLTDPARVIVDRKGRTTRFSRDFAVPDGVVTEFRRLGFDVGGKPGEPLVIGGPTFKQEILSADPVQKTTTDSTASKSNMPDDSAPTIQPQAVQDGEQPIKTIPVTSKELSGIWYGATDRTGVVVRFIGRESRIKNTRGVVSGEWVVHVVDGSIGATLEFTDDPKAGVVRITVGMWNVKTEQSYTSSLGSIERGEDDTLYLTINDNPKEPMYLATKRIPLTFINERDEIQRSDVEKMLSLVQTRQQKRPNKVPE